MQSPARQNSGLSGGQGSVQSVQGKRLLHLDHAGRRSGPGKTVSGVQGKSDGRRWSLAEGGSAVHNTRMLSHLCSFQRHTAIKLVHRGIGNA